MRAASVQSAPEFPPLINGYELKWWKEARAGSAERYGGVVAEAGVFAVVFATLRFFGQRAFLISILVASAVLPFFLAVWGRGYRLCTPVRRTT
jgi:hypothetical protein